MIQRTRAVVGLSFLCVTAAAPVWAQEPGKVGITMGYPSGIGVIWQAGDKVAIRPAIGFAGTSSGSTGITSDSSSWNLSPAISALFYMKRYDNVRTYVSPSYRYSHTTSTVHPSSSVQSTIPDIKSTTNTNGASGAFGAEYAPASRVRIYGEVGFAFTHSTQSSSGTSVLTGSGNTWGTTAGVGLVFYP